MSRFTNERFEEGQRVEHCNHGKGVVYSIPKFEIDSVVVKFDNEPEGWNTKKLRVGTNSLEILDKKNNLKEFMFAKEVEKFKEKAKRVGKISFYNEYKDKNRVKLMAKTEDGKINLQLLRFAFSKPNRENFIAWDDKNWIKKLEKQFKNNGIKVENEIKNNLYSLDKDKLYKKLKKQAVNDTFFYLEKEIENYNLGNWNRKISSVQFLLSFDSNLKEKYTIDNINNNKKLQEFNFRKDRKITKIFEKAIVFNEKKKANAKFIIKYEEFDNLEFKVQLSTLNFENSISIEEEELNLNKKSNKICRLLADCGWEVETAFGGGKLSFVIERNFHNRKAGLSFDFSKQKFSMRTTSSYNWDYKEVLEFEKEVKKVQETLEVLKKKGYEDLVYKNSKK